MSNSNRGEDQTPRLFTSNECTASSKRSILRKKLQAEKLALELKIAEQTFANEIECLRAEQQQRAKLLEPQKKAEESKLENEIEHAIAQGEGMSNKGDIDEELNKLPLDGVNDRVSRLDLEITEVSSEPRKKETCE